MSSTRLALIVSVIATSVGVAFACGPDFPWQLLDSRSGTLNSPIALSFSFEVKRLVPAPSDSLTAVEAPESYNSDPELEVVTSERKEASTGAWAEIIPEGANSSSEELLSKLKAARQSEDGKAALSIGAGLPVAVLAYIAGAIEFRAGRFDAAAEYFGAIDSLPEKERRIREVAAAYMLGRIGQVTGELEAAREWFQAARARALAGAPDPMGLAVASLGEEARVDLVEVRLFEIPGTISEAFLDDTKKGELIGSAVRLYVEQAARGSKIALHSLRLVASRLTVGPVILSLAVPDPLVRRFLVAYAVRRAEDGSWDDYDYGTEDSVVRNVIEAILAQPDFAAGEDLDRLAALAYQTGHYDVAEQLVAATEWPLGLWVRAKLAFRRNDRMAAVRDWAAALKATGGAGAAVKLGESAETRLRGEVAVMALSEGKYKDSLRLLFPVARIYWGDVAYVAERVLTVDELKTFVDGLPATPEPQLETTYDYVFVSKPVEALRSLLARRLVREGRAEEAQAYFSMSVPADQPSDTPSAAADGQAYLSAIEASRPTLPWRNVSRAEALFTIAMLTRKRGMELMGTEGPPDFAAIGGAFSYGFGQDSPVPPLEGNAADDVAWTERNRALLGPDEEKRFVASAPKYDIRYHYRMVASDQALAAADLLPERSQAYAATLCWASRFASDASDRAKAEKIYGRYVATGAFQHWAKAFGGTCPQPDFEAARTFWPRRIAGWAGLVVKAAERHAALLATGALVATLMTVGLIWLVRRRGGSAERG